MSSDHGPDISTADPPMDLERYCRTLQKLLLSASHTVTVFDAEGKVSSSTATGQAVLGYPSEWWVGRSMADLAHPDDLELGTRMLADVLGHPGEEFQAEVRVRHADGHYEWVALSAVNQLDDPDLLGIVVTTRNVSQHKHAEEELVSARESALQLAEAKSDYAAIVSHEIRAPLHSILGFAELLENQLDDPDQTEAASWSARIRGEAERLARMIDDLLDLARLDAGRASIRSEPFQLREVIGEVMEVARMRAEQRGLRLDASIDPWVSDWRSGDRDRLYEVLLNLVTNAIKFTSEGRVDIEVAPGAATRSTEWVRFSVTDTGPGIPPDEVTGIFEPFRQAASIDATRGSGLGLPISARLVEAMGGNRLDVSTLEGHGSTFHFELPLPLTREPGDAPAQRDASGPVGLNVLVVDDNATNRLLVEAQLMRLGCRCVLAEGGAEAIERVGSDTIDVVLMDCNMPDMDGFETARMIRMGERGTGRRLPILALTASALSSTREACERAGMDGFLAKPVMLSALAEGLHTAVPDSHHHRDTAAEPVRSGTAEASGPQDPTIDPERFTRLVDELGADSVSRVAATYMSEAPGRLAEIRRAAVQGDAEATRRSVHALRSPSAMLGASALAEALREVEHATDPVAASTTVELEGLMSATTTHLRNHIRQAIQDPEEVP